ncbi:MAG: sulfatase-like hydrolase/transferase [Bacteroidetes bacterium]|nr:sulfatase-like hydrolase/transferase [Bacteroidota bacterium]
MKKHTALPALLLLPAFFLLHNYNELFGFIPVKEIFSYAALFYLLLAAGYGILRIMKLSSQKAALILFPVVLFMLYFKPIHKAWVIITFKTFFISHYMVMLPVFCLLLVLLARKIIRMEKISPKTSNFLNIVVICLLVVDIITAFQKAAALNKNHNLIYPGKPLSDKYVPLKNIPDSAKPDIYFFVFDEYTNNSTLKKMWGYDNSSITDWLSSEGFDILSSTKANYSYTVFSVSSTFNMNYLDKKVGGDGTITENVLKANQSLSNNETFSILQKENYTIHFIAPFSNTIHENGLGHFFDYLIDDQIPSQTLPASLSTTILTDLITTGYVYKKDSIKFEEEIDEKFEQIKNTIEQVKQTTDSNSNRKPNFVYGHILVPHVPHVYDSAGKRLSFHEYLATPLFDTYTAQVKLANALIKELISHIKTNNKRNTIIIVEGDHGFRRFPESQKELWLPNFYAVYFPDHNYSMLYDTMTPVNAFRIVFNKFFNQHYPLLKDSSVCVKDYFY